MTLAFIQMLRVIDVDDPKVNATFMFNSIPRMPNIKIVQIQCFVGIQIWILPSWPFHFEPLVHDDLSLSLRKIFALKISSFHSSLVLSLKNIVHLVPAFCILLLISKCICCFIPQSRFNLRQAFKVNSLLRKCLKFWSIWMRRNV